MPEIRTIGISPIRPWSAQPTLSVPNAPPVTVNIGVPIIDLPAFDPLDYRGEEVVVDPEPVLPRPEPTTPPAPKVPPPAAFKLPKAAVDQDPRCPPLRAKEVGTLVQNGEKRISGYEIQDGKCVVLFEEIPLPEQVIAAIPTIPQVTTVGVSAVIGVGAGMCTPALLRIVKPTIKNIVKKIQAVEGKTFKRLSVFERRKAQRSARE